MTDAAVYRDPEDQTKAVEMREEPTPISLNRATLQRLYFSWVKSKDQYFALVNNTAFRKALQYFSPVVNDMASRSDSTVILHTLVWIIQVSQVSMIRERVGFKTLLAVSRLVLQTKRRIFKNEELHEIGQQRDLPVRGAGYEPSTTRT